MTRYTIVTHRTLFRCAAVCGTLGAVLLIGGLYLLFGPISENGETRDPTGLERAGGCFQVLWACLAVVTTIHHVLTPSTIEVRPDGSMVIDRLVGRKTIPIGDIRTIDWRIDRRILTIRHGKRTASLGPFNHAAEFISDVRWMRPDVAVTVSGPNGPSNGGDLRSLSATWHTERTTPCSKGRVS